MALGQGSSSIVITTRNRKDDLRRALVSAFAQSAPAEVLVMDDASTDGTSAMVRQEFPTATLHRTEACIGLIAQRNRAAKLVASDVIISIDDDAEFSTPFVVEQTLREFDDPQIGAVAIPYIEPHKDNRLMQQAPDRQGLWVTERFIGTAHALRRDVFLKVGGYRDHLVHQGEEGDYCIRMLDAGYLVRLGNADPIHHFESPKRDLSRMDYYGARNAILFVWQNVPWPAFPVHLLATTLNVLRWTFQPRRFCLRLRAVLAGYGWCLTHWSARQPVARRTYQINRVLRRGGAVPASAVQL